MSGVFGNDLSCLFFRNQKKILRLNKSLLFCSQSNVLLFWGTSGIFLLVCSKYSYMVLIKTVFLLIIFRNRNGMQHFLGIGRTGRVFHLFHLFHRRERNSWKSRNSWNGVDRFGWALDFYPRTEWFLCHLNWNRWSLEYLFQVFFFLEGLKRNAT